MQKANITLDIYSFLRSQDVADYCRQIGHVFNPLEMAIIIDRSEKTPMEKMFAWQILIDHYPDMSLHISVPFKIKDSLHEYLRALIVFYRNHIKRFYKKESDAKYSLIWVSASKHISNSLRISLEKTIAKTVMLIEHFGSMDIALKRVIRLVPGSEQDDYPVPHKGIFWLIKNADDNDELLSVNVPCDPNGYPLKSADFSSVSGKNFNYRAEWEKLPPELTQGKPFDYYPMGRVEIKDRKVTVYCHPSLTQSPYRLMITGEFGVPSATTRFVADGSIHYQARKDTE